MKVLFLATDAYGGHGGIAQYCRDMAQALAELPETHEVAVLMRKVSVPGQIPPDKVRLLNTASLGKLAYIRLALHETFNNRFDLILCGHINLLPVAACIKWLNKQKPLALLVYGIDAWQQHHRLTRAWLRQVDAVWSISRITIERMTSWAKLSAAKCTILPNAIHLDQYGQSGKRTDLLSCYGLRGKVLLTLGRLSSLERYKGVDEVIELLPDLLRHEPDLSYLVAGEGDDRARLMAKADAMGLGDHVVFTGMIDEAEKADIFRLADAYVMPSRGEGFGFVFLEALACGVPAVGSQLDGSREALRDGLLGELVDPQVPASIRQGILRALAKPRAIPPELGYFAWPAFAERVGQAVRDLFKLSPVALYETTSSPNHGD